MTDADLLHRLYARKEKALQKLGRELEELDLAISSMENARKINDKQLDFIQNPPTTPPKGGRKGKEKD
ncbi:MAG: hypothetical protein [Microvirus sp.]|nr:MAG: hypothetical protein [Microvirus sp.]